MIFIKIISTQPLTPEIYATVSVATPRDTANASDVLYFSDISAFLFVEMRQMLCCVIMIDPRI